MIDLLEPIQINGSRQWLLERGEDAAKPLILFVHGGPGSPLMYFSRAFDERFLKDFVVVHWDQRGSGKSYDSIEPKSNFHFRQYVDDGLAVVDHLLTKYKRSQLILLGHSWGTMLAFNMVAQRPDMFAALITVGTVSDMGKMEEFRYQTVLSAIENSKSNAAKEKLLALGAPPFLSFANLMSFGELVTEFVGFNRTFNNLTMEQLNEGVGKNQEYSESEMQASMDGMKHIFEALSQYLYSYKALDAVPEVEVPVYFVQGKFDFNTPTHLAQRYYNELKADKGKTWIEFSQSAHFPFYEEPENFLKVLKKISLEWLAVQR